MFEVGNVVQLKSGGAYMTVAVVAGDYCECVWVDEHGTPERQFIEAHCLMLYEEPDETESK